VASFVVHGEAEVLGFNEPDNKDQPNIPVMKALELWPAFEAAGIRAGSPGTAANAYPGQKWFADS
jgi:hypothetical protein